MTGPHAQSRRWPWRCAVAAAIFLHGAAILAAPAPEFVNGRVLDANGEPAIARVAIFNDGRRAQVQCGHADECFERLLAAGAARAVGTSGVDGRFVLRVPGGLRWDDTVWAEGADASGQGIRTFWPVAPNRALPTSTLGDIQLNQRLDFFVVVESAGRPIAGAEVDFGNGERLRTDASGTVSRHMQVAAPGSASSGWTMAFTVRAEGFAAEEWASGVPAGTTTQVVELVPESVQAGRILDPSGWPIADATITAVSEAASAAMIHASGSRPPDRTAGSSRTDATGAFALHGLRPGRRYRLSISTDHAGIGDAERSIIAGGAPMDIVMAAAAPTTLPAMPSADLRTLTLEGDLALHLRSIMPNRATPNLYVEQGLETIEAIGREQVLMFRRFGTLGGQSPVYYSLIATTDKAALSAVSIHGQVLIGPEAWQFRTTTKRDNWQQSIPVVIEALSQLARSTNPPAAPDPPPVDTRTAEYVAVIHYTDMPEMDVASLGIGVGTLGYASSGSAPGLRMDLNNDQAMELIVRGSTDSCGTGGCTHFIFDGKSGTQIGVIFGRPLVVHAATINGWPVLSAYSHGSATSGSYTTFVHDGQRYIRSTSVTLHDESVAELFRKLRSVEPGGNRNDALAR